MRRSAQLAAAVSLVAFGFVPRASAYVDDDYDPGAAPNAPKPASSTSFAGVLGMPAIARAARSSDAVERASAVARAAEIALGTGPSSLRDEAWRIVESAAADAIGDDLDASLRVRLAAARALSKSPRKESRKALQNLLTSPAPSPRPVTPPYPTGPWPTPGGGWGGTGPFGPVPWTPPGIGPRVVKAASPSLVRLVRDTAAMALATVDEHEHLLARARAGRDDAETSRAAQVALLAYPAPSLSSILPKGEDPPPRDLVELLVRLGDPRTADVLLAAAKGKDEIAAGSALVALARLGDGRAASIARAIAEGARVELRVAAAEALAELDDASADAAISALLADEKTATFARAIAVRHPRAQRVAVIEPVANAGDPEAIAALGRVGKPGVPALLSLLKGDGKAADLAAHQLALMPVSEADDALVEALEAATTTAQRRRIVRAGAIRAVRIGSVPSAIRSAAKTLAKSEAPADRSIGTTLRAILELDDARAALASDDLVLRRAAAIALPAHPRAEAAAVARAHLAARATTESKDVVRALAAVVARDVDGTAARDVPLSTATLAAWLAEDGLAAPIAAFLLAARGGDAASVHAARARASDSLDVRAAAYLGLGVTSDPSATGILMRALLEEPHAPTRRAIARALIARADPSAASSLEITRRLDPDPEVRAIVRAEKPVRTSPLSLGHEVAVLAVSVSADVSPQAVVTGKDGLASPVLVDPDGFVVVHRVAPGGARIEVRP